MKEKMEEVWANEDGLVLPEYLISMSKVCVEALEKNSDCSMEIKVKPLAALFREVMAGRRLKKLIYERGIKL